MFQRVIPAAVALAALITPTALSAAPAIRITPPQGARLVPGQYFDLRVEYAGVTLSAVFLSVDGVDQGIGLGSLDAAGGVTRRKRSFLQKGLHTVRAQATDSNGSTDITRQLEVVDVMQDLRGLDPVRNVIILLGDGMGASHRTAARIMRYGATAGHVNGRLAMDKMPGFGMVITSSLNSIVTDSAPGMANYVTGNKAQNNQEGVFPDNTAAAFDNPRIEYLAEYLHRTQGKSLGIISTADIEDATPAANAVHTSNRNAGTGICDQYLDERSRSGLTVLMGGGRRWFLPSGQFGSSRTAATDYVLPAELASAYAVPAGAIDPTRDLLADFQAAGFNYASNRTELEGVPDGATKLLGLFAYGNMNVSFDKIAGRRGNPDVVNAYHAPDQPMLDEMLGTALKVLNKNANGFVLTVEGAHIDKQSHLMDAERSIWDVIEFDRAVEKAVAFAKHEGHTLVIVTADHECSGLSILGASTKTTAELQGLASEIALVNPTDHPARQAAVGLYDAAAFPSYPIADDGYPATPMASDFKPLQFGFGAGADHFEDWLSKPKPIIDSLLPDDIRAELVTAAYAVNPIDRKPESDNGFFIRGPVPGTQAAHTATDIPLTAFSSGSPAWQDFVGVMDNSDVFFKIVKATTRRRFR